MESVLVIGRIRPDRTDDVDTLLAAGDVGSRIFRHGETLALLVDAPRAESRFLHLLRDESFAKLVGCLEEMPLMPREVPSATG